MNSTPFHFDVATRRYFFIKLPDGEVAKEMIVRAEHVRAFVCRDLGIDSRIVWIHPIAPSSKREPPKANCDEEMDVIVRLERNTTGGFTPSKISLHEIWIFSQPEEVPHLEGTIAHELRHAWQKEHHPEVFKYDEARSEADAYAYSYEVLKRYFASSGRLTDELRRIIDREEADMKEWFRGLYPHGEYKILYLRPPG